MAENKIGPTLLGRVVIILFLMACLVAAGYFFRNTLFPSAQKADKGKVDLTKYQKEQGGVEALDPNGITTVSKYTYLPSQKLPPVKGASNYKWDNTRKIVQFPINVWIGWLPIVAANHGFAPNEESIFYKKYGFKVNLKLIDDPVVARDTYATGASQSCGELWI